MPLSRRGLLLVGALAPLAACAGAPQWRPIGPDAEPLALTTLAGGLLVGLAGSRGPALQGPDGAIGVRTSSDYGREARWVGLASWEGRIVGIGMTRGGAHGNARWSVFAGTADAGVAEREQPFDVFHGYGAGQLVAASFVAGRSVLVGSWQSAAAGLDVALWRTDGDRWSRRPSTGTVLAATSRSLPQAHAAAGGTRLMIVGQVIELAPLRTRAVAWTCTDPDADWTRIDLPGAGTTTVAESVAAHPDGWLIGGRSDARLTAWTVAPDLSVRTVPVPQVAAADRTRVAASADGALLIVATDGNRIEALRGRPGAWERTSPPGSAPVAAAWATDPAVITADGPNPRRLFALS